MNEPGKSDNRVVPEKVSNKARRRRVAERLEERRLGERNRPQARALRTQGRTSVHAALGRVRRAAEEQKGVRFTALLHHIYAIDTLRAAFYELERDAAPGVDGQTWAEYGQGLEARLVELSDRVRRGAYRPQPVRRVYVPKRDGKQQRPIGVAAVEDKIVQRATVAVLTAVYEPEFVDFSYGARPGRSAHQALAALDQGLMKMPSDSWSPCERGWSSLGCSCTRTRRVCWSLGGTPRRTEEGEAKGSRRPFNCWVLSTAVDGPEGEGSWCAGTRSANGCGPSSRRSRLSCGSAGTTRFPR